MKTRKTKNRRATPLVECHHCHGTGELPLGPEMMLTLDALRFLKQATVPEVSTAILWEGHITAINNRLTHLQRLGFARRVRKAGKNWIYEATPLPA